NIFIVLETYRMQTNHILGAILSYSKHRTFSNVLYVYTKYTHHNDIHAHTFFVLFLSFSIGNYLLRSKLVNLETEKETEARTTTQRICTITVPVQEEDLHDAISLILIIFSCQLILLTSKQAQFALYLAKIPHLHTALRHWWGHAVILIFYPLENLLAFCLLRFGMLLLAASHN
ncbi:hypothetical protein ACJX0J_022292, partial [Zea mays]